MFGVVEFHGIFKNSAALFRILQAALNCGVPNIQCQMKKNSFNVPSTIK